MWSSEVVNTTKMMTVTAEAQRLLSAADIRRLAEHLQLRPTKSWGQNYVIDPNTIRRIVDQAQLDPTEHVLEIGPGLGSLTLGLLDQATAVTAVEIDPVPAAALLETLEHFRPGASRCASVLQADALQIDADQLHDVRPVATNSAPTALVANLPYNVAVPVLLHILASVPSIRHGLVMVQQEVADRLCAAPGTKIYGVPSAKLAWYATARSAGTVGTHVFWPAPRIKSGLVHFHQREPIQTTASRNEVFTVIDEAFAQRRKTLRAALSNWAGSGASAERILRAAGLNPQARGEVLSIEDFAAIAEQSKTLGVGG